MLKKHLFQGVHDGQLGCGLSYDLVRPGVKNTVWLPLPTNIYCFFGRWKRFGRIFWNSAWKKTPAGPESIICY